MPKSGLVLIGVVFTVLAAPWLIGIESRPMIPVFEASQVESIFKEERDDLFLYGYRLDIAATQNLAEMIADSDCRSVGMQISGGGPEYVWWHFLDAPFTPIRIEWVVRGTASEKYADQTFLPCAVICDYTCPQDINKMGDLLLASEQRQFRLYLHR